MTVDRAIQHIPFDLGFGCDIEPAGRLRLSYKNDWGDWSAERDEWGWITDKLTAEFGLGSDFSEFVRIEFEGPMIFQVLDETWESLASDSTRWIGDLTTFAREVIGHEYAALNSLFFSLNGGGKHYQFVTGEACLDVIARSEPRASMHRSEV
jgi:hypothetical protein